MDDALFLIYIFVAGCALFFALFAPEIMRLLADEKYYEAVYVIPPVAIGMVFSFMYTTFANVEFYYDQNKFTMYISMGGALLNIALNYVGIKVFGYIAAAYTTLFCYAVFALGHYIYMTISVKKALKINHVFNTMRLCILSLSVLLLGLAVIIFYEQIWIRHLMILIIGVIAYKKKDELFLALSDLQSVKKRKGQDK